MLKLAPCLILAQLKTNQEFTTAERKHTRGGERIANHPKGHRGSTKHRATWPFCYTQPEARRHKLLLFHVCLRDSSEVQSTYVPEHTGKTGCSTLSPDVLEVSFLSADTTRISARISGQWCSSATCTRRQERRGSTMSAERRGPVNAARHAVGRWGCGGKNTTGFPVSGRVGALESTSPWRSV